MNFRKFPIAAAVMLLAGCTVGPNFVKPEASVPQTWCASTCEAARSDASHVTGQPVNPAWWTAFNDPELVKLENAVANSNLDLKVASLRLAESRATRTITAADKYPSVEANAEVKRAQASANGVLSALDPAVSNGTAPINVYQAGFDASWELDLWGQVRRQVEEQSATAQASEATLANATLSEQIALANAVINLRITDADIDLLTHTVQVYTDFLRVVANQDQAGTVPPSDLISARTQLESRLVVLALSQCIQPPAHAL